METLLSQKEMDKRLRELTDLKAYIENIDKETTLFLQSVQWDYKKLSEHKTMVCCKYVSHHRIPLEKKEDHEKQCYLTLHGYAKEEVLLPDPINPYADTIIKLNKEDIMRVISTASSSKPSFKRAPGPEPMSVERLQQTYSADERRAIYDAVVSAAPACHDLTDLALPSTSSQGPQSSQKSRAEILAELRDMKRRRAKYRVASKTTNYSDTLRDVIKQQMELYSQAKGISIKTEYGPKTYVSLNQPESSKTDTVPTDIVIKRKRVSPESDVLSKASRKDRKRSRSRDRHDRTRKHDRDGYRKREEHFSRKSNGAEKRRQRDYSQDGEECSSRERRRFEDDISIAYRSFDVNNFQDSRDSRESRHSKGKHRDRNEPKTQGSPYKPSSSCKERYLNEEFSNSSGLNMSRPKKYKDKTYDKDSRRHREVHVKERDFYEFREQMDSKRCRDVEKKDDYYDSHEKKKRKRH